MKTVFQHLHVFVNREVPLRPIYFTLLCGGVSEVGWERGSAAGGSAGQGSAFSIGHKAITHHVIDRPADQIETRAGREYIQPQWVFDSFNTGCLLPIAPYAPGRTPPPHLSPFVDDATEGYVPRQREILNQFATEALGAPATSSTSAASRPTDEAGTDAPQSRFDKFNEELRAEQSGVWHADFQEQQKKRAEERLLQLEEDLTQKDAAEANANESKAPATDQAEDAVEEPAAPAPKPTEAEEERLRAKALMPKKHKRLLQRIETAATNKSNANERLKKKRQQLETKKANVA